MLELQVQETEFYDEVQCRFITVDAVTVQLEHSLFTLSRWEEIYEKPFLGNTEKSDADVHTYIDAMVLTPNVPKNLYLRLTDSQLMEVSDYISGKHTATWFREGPEKPSPAVPQVITAEIIYFWMIAFKVPQEYQYWHLNKLLTLIRVCEAKNNDSQKKPNARSRSDVLAERRALNAKRKAEMGTSG